MRRIMSGLVRVVDKTNESAKIFAFLILAIIFNVAFEVISRYIFDKPTSWAWGLNEQLLSAMVVIGGGFALLHGIHVKGDMLYGRWSNKMRAIVDLITSFLPLVFCGVLLFGVSKLARSSVASLERDSAFFDPPVYPLKVLIAIGILLIFIEVIANVFRNILILTRKEQLLTTQSSVETSRNSLNE